MATKQKGFLRGYGFQGGSNQPLQTAKSLPGFGAEFKKKTREWHPWAISLGGFGECLARYENHVRINREVVDARGIPVLHIDMAFSDNERNMVYDMGEMAGEILEAAGAQEIRVSHGPTSTPGILIHEVGTARMGNDPKKEAGNSKGHEVAATLVTTTARSANPWPSAASATARDRKPSIQTREAQKPEAERNEQTQSLYSAATDVGLGCELVYLRLTAPAQSQPLQIGVVLAHQDNERGNEINQAICRIVRARQTGADAAEWFAKLNQLLSPNKRLETFG